MFDPVREHIRHCPACSGNPDIVLKGFNKKLLASLSEQERDMLRQTLDPMHWAKTNLLISQGGYQSYHSNDRIIEFIESDPKLVAEYGSEWEEFKKDLQKHPEGFPYQERIIRCNYPRIVCRAGRRIGKSWAFAVKMLNVVFTRPNTKFVIFTNTLSNLKNIMGDSQGSGILRALIDNNTDLSNCITKQIDTPYPLIRINNGSSIEGFVSGSAALRGHDAEYIWLDEASYLTTSDLGMVNGLLLSRPEMVLWATSTPQGQKDWFKDKSSDKVYKKFFFPGMFKNDWGIPNPITGQTPEESLRSELQTEDIYNREVLALFDSGKIGVFKQEYVDVAFNNDKDPSHFTYNPDWKYVAGVDWNSSRHGTRICIIGTPDLKTFYVVKMDKVGAVNWTQTFATDKIFQLNREWHFSAIYVDNGYGSTQVENMRLRSYGSDNPQDYNVAKIVQPVDLGSNIEIVDPFSKMKVPKPLKGFMVNNAVRFFERADLVIPKRFEKLKEQIENYQVRNISDHGQYRYGPPKGLEDTIGDHDLDAFMFALLGFTMKFSILGKPNYFSGMRPMVNPNIQRLASQPNTPKVDLAKPPSREIVYDKEKKDTDASSLGRLTQQTNSKQRLSGGSFRVVNRGANRPRRSMF